MDCFARSIKAGIEYSGLGFGQLLYDILPKPTPDYVAVSLCKNLGLDVHTTGTVLIDKRPVLIGYYLNVPVQLVKPVYGSKMNAHVVFCSDLEPFVDFNLTLVVKGFDNLSQIWYKNIDERRVALALLENGSFCRVLRLGQSLLNLKNCRFLQLKNAVWFRYL